MRRHLSLLPVWWLVATTSSVVTCTRDEEELLKLVSSVKIPMIPSLGGYFPCAEEIDEMASDLKRDFDLQHGKQQQEATGKNSEAARQNSEAGGEDSEAAGKNDEAAKSHVPLRERKKMAKQKEIEEAVMLKEKKKTEKLKQSDEFTIWAVIALRGMTNTNHDEMVNMMVEKAIEMYPFLTEPQIRTFAYYTVIQNTDPRAREIKEIEVHPWEEWHRKIFKWRALLGYMRTRDEPLWVLVKVRTAKSGKDRVKPENVKNLRNKSFEAVCELFPYLRRAVAKGLKMRYANTFETVKQGVDEVEFIDVMQPCHFEQAYPNLKIFLNFGLQGNLEAKTTKKTKGRSRR